MPIPSVYINLEDDVSKIMTRLSHQSSSQVVLVCPKRCFLLSDSINLRLLKKQADIIGKEIFILTMDERGQNYAKEAGFQLKFLPKDNGTRVFSDIRVQKRNPAPRQKPEVYEPARKEDVYKVDDKKTAAALPAEYSEAESFVEFKPEPKIIAPVIRPEPAQIDSVRQQMVITDNIFPAEAENHLETKKEQKSHVGRIIFGIFIVSVVVILLLVFVVLPKASVVIYPKTESVTRDMEISMSVNTTSPDADKLIMPAFKVNETVNVSDKFQSKGKKQVGNKSSGTVQIYNFTKLPLNLKAATTMLTVAGKNYNLVNDINGLKPTTYTNAKTKEINQSSLGDLVQIIATDGGDDYNLPAGTRMEITNQVLGSKPQVLYAKTDSEISGGTTRYLSVISQDDYISAQKQLQDEALNEIKQKLQGQNLNLADGSYSVTISKFTTDNAVGAETPSFQGSLQAQIIGLSFKADDLTNIITQRIGETLASNKSLQTGVSGQTTYKAKDLDINNELAVLDVHYQGQAVYNVDISDMANQFKGKSQDDVQQIISSKTEVDKAEITLAPYWQKNLPMLVNKISVTTAVNLPNQ